MEIEIYYMGRDGPLIFATESRENIESSNWHIYLEDWIKHF
jgi:hypothetical protein